MSNLSNSIRAHYLLHLNELPLDKQFHFASRLTVWSGDEQCRELLQQLQSQLLPDTNVHSTLAAIAEGTLIPLLPGNERLLRLRQPYNERYPQLRGAARLLYWAVMLDRTYNTNARVAISDLVPETDMQQLYEALLMDDDAVAILATYAVNFMYLYRRYYKQAAGPNPLHFGRIAAGSFYDMSNPLHVQSCAYLLTHAVIADSLFYAEPLPPGHKTAHVQLLSQLEAMLEPHLADISLDNKLEFLVCCQLAGFISKLETAILAEAAQSVSPNGTFLVDTHNTSASPYVSLAKSEHRNVLYIMSSTPRHHTNR